jgi:hypothetical protein
MDIKALYKVSDVAKYVAEKDKEDKENQNNPEDPGDGDVSVEDQIKDLYDRTTIQYEDKDKNLPEITLKQDYLDTKSSLEKDISDLKGKLEDYNPDLDEDIKDISDKQAALEKSLSDHQQTAKNSFEVINGKYTELEGKLNEHLSSTGGTPGTLTNPIEFYSKSTSGNPLVGSVGTGTIGASSSNRRDELCVSSEYSSALTLGSKTSNDVYTRNLIITSDDFANSGTRFYKGVNIIDGNVYNTMRFIDGSISLDQDTQGNNIGHGELYVSKAPSRGFNVFGQHFLDIGIKPNGNELSAFYISDTYVDYDIAISLQAPMYAGNNIISGANIVNEVSGQSEYTTNLINNGTNENIMYGNMSYDSGEIRWCWKETVFTYKEADVDPETDEWVYTGRHICYIELPIFMAENIQNDYHINICKMSWGDYRIIEKNPYYFILESQEEDFAFTFEVVAKLNDNQTLNNNAIIANTGYKK